MTMTQIKTGILSNPVIIETPDGGITKRELFAAMAMHGLLAGAKDCDVIYNSVRAADLLIEEPNKSTTSNPPSETL